MTPGIPVGTKLTKMMTSFRMPEIVRKYISPVVPSSAKKPILFSLLLKSCTFMEIEKRIHSFYFFVQIQNRSYARYADRCRDLASGFKWKTKRSSLFVFLSLFVKPDILIIWPCVFGLVSLNCLRVTWSFFFQKLAIIIMVFAGTFE